MLLNPYRFASSSGGLPSTPFTYAYWRIYVTAAVTPSNGYVSLSEIEFFKWGVKTSSPTYVNSTADSSHFGTRTASNLFNGHADDSSGQWTSGGGSPPHWASVRYNGAIDVDKIRIYPSYEQAADRSPADFLLQYSSDGVTWNTALTVVGASGWVYGVYKDYQIADLGPPPPRPGHRYWRLTCSATNGDAYFAMQEIEFRESVGGATVTDSSMTATASTYFGSNTPAQAIDGDYSDYSAHAYISDGSAMPQWWKVDMGVNFDIAEVAIFPQNYSGGPARAPKDFVIAYSDDNSTWTTWKSVTGATTYTAGTGTTFTP